MISFPCGLIIHNDCKKVGSRNFSVPRYWNVNLGQPRPYQLV